MINRKQGQEQGHDQDAVKVVQDGKDYNKPTKYVLKPKRDYETVTKEETLSFEEFEKGVTIDGDDDDDNEKEEEEEEEEDDDDDEDDDDKVSFRSKAIKEEEPGTQEGIKGVQIKPTARLFRQ